MISLRQTLYEIKNDLPKNDLLIKAFIINYLYSPRFRILLNYRLGKYFFHSKIFLFRQIGVYYKTKMVSKRNCDISYKAIIGKNMRMPHPFGIVIGEGVIIKDNVMIFQQVTLGSHGKKAKFKSYPIIESNVKIYAGAKIIGGITIGEDAIIGANAVVNINIPLGGIAVGVPCKLI